MIEKPPRSPDEYRVVLDVDFPGLSWSGTVEFDEPGDAPERILDTDRLEVTQAREDGIPVPFELSSENGALRIRRVARKPSMIAVEFAGRVETSALMGLYRSSYGDGGYLLTTHCEPIGARKIFPCVDRPDRKARIRLTVRTGSDLEVVSNTIGRSSTLSDGRREWTFEPTPPMATYLLYLAIGRFDRFEDRTGGFAIRVLTPPGRGASGRFAAESARRILRAYEEYYRIPYPLPKLDLIAVPEFAVGAMENWGAITFLESRLLLDSSSGSFAPRDTFETIAHELAHQWFGNLVTMAWWDDIWLNESFASFMETKITERIEPSFDPWADFFLRLYGAAHAEHADSLRSTHPVRAAVERPEEIGQIFDEISYGKGASVLAMFEAYLGEEPFRAGVTDYLTKFRFGNARTEDLWEALERASGEPVRALVGPWIDRPGFPVVTARLTPKGLALTQRRFSYLGSTDQARWPIPMVVGVDGHRERVRFDRESLTLPVPESATVHLNPGAVGYYRVLYDATLYERLLQSLPNRPATDRWVVLEDLAAFLSSGDVGWPLFERFVRRLGATSERMVVESLVGSLLPLALAFPGIDAIQALTRSFLGEQYERLGPSARPGEPAAEGILRERVSFARAQVDLGFAAEVAGNFARWERLDPDLRPAVALAYARTGGESAYRSLRRALEGTAIEVEAWRLARGLAWTADAGRVRETLDFALSGAVNRGHVPSIIGHAASNPIGRPVTWSWLQDHLAALVQRFEGSGFLPTLFDRTLPLLGIGRTEEVRQFFQDHPVPEGSRGIVKSLERLEVFDRLSHRLTATPTA
jgi:tricorn protease interacting factor F2/3